MLAEGIRNEKVVLKFSSLQHKQPCLTAKSIHHRRDLLIVPFISVNDEPHWDIALTQEVEGGACGIVNIIADPSHVNESYSGAG